MRYRYTSKTEKSSLSQINERLGKSPNVRLTGGSQYFYAYRLSRSDTKFIVYDNFISRYIEIEASPKRIRSLKSDLERIAKIKLALLKN